jgi:hypothetical protein
VSQVGTIGWLAVRELWISFRLLVLLVAFVGVGAVVALLPAPLPVTLGRLAVGLAVASLVGAAVAAWSIAEERVRGRAAWLVTRSVPRSTILGGWWSALGITALLGTGAAAVLGWLAASAVALRFPTDAFAAIGVAVAATALVAMTVGLLAGLLLPPRAAAPVAVVACAAIGLVAWVVPGAAPWAPGSALASLAGLAEASRPLAVAWREAGAALVTVAVLLVVARGLIERIDL